MNETIIKPALPAAHPLDLLVVGWLREADHFPQFRRLQVVSANTTQQLYGRRLRRVLYTAQSRTVPGSLRFFRTLEPLLGLHQAELYPIEQYEALAEQDRLAEQVNEVYELHHAA